MGARKSGLWAKSLLLSAVTLGRSPDQIWVSHLTGKSTLQTGCTPQEERAYYPQVTEGTNSSSPQVNTSISNNGLELKQYPVSNCSWKSQRQCQSGLLTCLLMLAPA